jgi:hypothetical protein
MFSVAKHVYLDDGIIDTIGFTIDRDDLRVLKAKIDALLIGDDKANKKKK